MTKHDIISKVTASTGLEYQQVSAVVEALFSSVKDAVILGNSASFREFGIFSSKTRPAKFGRNIRKNILIDVPEQRIVVFKPAGKFKEEVRECSLADASSDVQFSILFEK